MPNYAKPVAQKPENWLAALRNLSTANASGGTEYIYEYPRRSKAEAESGTPESERGVCVAILGNIAYGPKGESTELSGWGIAVYSEGAWHKVTGGEGGGGGGEYTAKAPVKITGKQIELEALGITGSYIAEGTLTTSKYANASVTGEKLASSVAGEGLELAGGKLAIAAEGVNGGMIAFEAITNNRLAKETLTAEQIAAATIAGSNVATETLTGGSGGNVGKETLTGYNIAEHSLTENNYGAESVTLAAMAVASVGEEQIVSGAVHAGNLATSAVTEAKINAGAVSASKVAVATTPAKATEGTEAAKVGTVGVARKVTANIFGNTSKTKFTVKHGLNTFNIADVTVWTTESEKPKELKNEFIALEGIKVQTVSAEEISLTFEKAPGKEQLWIQVIG